MRSKHRDKKLCTTEPCHQSKDMTFGFCLFFEVHKILPTNITLCFICAANFLVLGSDEPDCQDHPRGISHPSGFLDIFIFLCFVCLINRHNHIVSCCLCSLLLLLRYLGIKESITGHVIHKPLAVLARSHYSILQISVLSVHITLTG